MARAKVLLSIGLFLLFCILLSPVASFAYTSADVPVGHWSYEAADRLAIAGLLGLSGIDTRPMTRVQMAFKIKEVIDNIEEERIPLYLSLEREEVGYLQAVLYKLINEFREELILIGVTSAQIKGDDERSSNGSKFNYAIAPLQLEQRYVSIRGRKDTLLENENGLRLEQGYNLRARVNGWVNALNTFTVSARPAARVSASGTKTYLDEGAAKVSLANLELSIGKSAMWWGPGYRGAMVLSNNAAPLTAAKLRTINDFRLPGFLQKIGSFGINFFVSQLEKDRTIPSPKIAGLRLAWTPLSCLSFGANRTSIFGGSGQPKPGLSDYYRIFIASEELSSSTPRKYDSDQLASVDAKLALPFGSWMPLASGMEAYTEWAGEDRFYVVRNESPGILAGLRLVDLFRNPGTDFRFEYAKNKPNWYNHFKYGTSGTLNAYAYKDEIMGHRMGGDADDWFFRLSKDLPALSTSFFTSATMGGQLEFQRHNVSQAATHEQLYEPAIDLTWAHGDKLYLCFKYEFEYYRNYNAVAGATAKNHILSAEMDLKF
ncbi:MAG: capsule assembly Wzi family protein [Candidatus Omnitrophota bacterium]